MICKSVGWQFRYWEHDPKTIDKKLAMDVILPQRKPSGLTRCDPEIKS